MALKFCGFRGKHRPAIFITGIFVSGEMEVMEGMSVQWMGVERSVDFRILAERTYYRKHRKPSLTYGMYPVQQADQGRHGRLDILGEACRNEYHNAETIQEHAEIRKITLVLRQNRRILKGLLGNLPEVYVPR